MERADSWLFSRLSRSAEQSFPDYVDLAFEASQASFESGHTPFHLVHTPLQLVHTPFQPIHASVNLIEAFVNLAETLVGVRLELAETLVESSFRSMQGRQRDCCQSNTNGEDADKYGKDAGNLSHSNEECTTRLTPAIQPRR